MTVLRSLIQQLRQGPRTIKGYAAEYNIPAHGGVAGIANAVALFGGAPHVTVRRVEVPAPKEYSVWQTLANDSRRVEQDILAAIDHAGIQTGVSPEDALIRRVTMYASE